jgi:hypothetical protein
VLFAIIGAVSTAIGVVLDIPLLVPALGALAAVIGLISTEWYRHAHSFIITNYRLIMRVDFWHYRERELLWSRISDLAIEQTMVGRIFNFGTLIPISLSGFGLGEDSAAAIGSIQRNNFSIGIMGGKAQNVPRGTSAHVLFGVPNPRAVHNTIEKFIHENTEVVHLKEIEKGLQHVKFLKPES